jgi:hypothetical protein
MVDIEGIDVDVEVQEPEDINIDVDDNENESEEELKEPKEKKKRKEDTGVDKKLIIKTLVRIAKHLDYIKKNTFQRDISERIDLIGEELDFLADILGVRKCEG